MLAEGGERIVTLQLIEDKYYSCYWMFDSSLNEFVIMDGAAQFVFDDYFQATSYFAKYLRIGRLPDDDPKIVERWKVINYKP